VHCKRCGSVVLERLPYVDSYRNTVAVFFGNKSKTLYIRYPNAAKSRKQRSLEPALCELNSVAATLHMMPDARADVMDLYTELYRSGFTRGRNRSLVLAACLLMVSRKQGYPVLVSDVAKLFAVDGNEVIKMARKICNSLNIGLQPADVLDFIPRFGQDLILSELAITLAMEIAYGCKDRVSLSFITLAASCLQLASRLVKKPISYRKIHKVLGVTPAALSRAVQMVKEGVDIKEIEKLLAKMG
jgi:transcription initiation factor TFIIB